MRIKVLCSKSSTYFCCK